MIRYCPGLHDTGTVVVNVPLGSPPYCCEHCADEDKPDQCSCGVTEFQAPYIDALPPSHPLAK